MIKLKEILDNILLEAKRGKKIKDFGIIYIKNANAEKLLLKKDLKLLNKLLKPVKK